MRNADAPAKGSETCRDLSTRPRVTLPCKPAPSRFARCSEDGAAREVIAQSPNDFQRLSAEVHNSRPSSFPPRLVRLAGERIRGEDHGAQAPIKQPRFA